MRSEGDSSTEADREAKDKLDHSPVKVEKPQPSWVVVEAKHENYFGHEIIEAVLTAMSRLLKKEVESISTKGTK